MFISISVNSNVYQVKPGLSIMQACEFVNVSVPRFCYHERLSVAGNCRICLVEVEKMPKLQVSCAVLIADKMTIYTNTPLVLKAREGILEFLLINHPLDCPICDQGGECDLQEQSIYYGGDKNRFKEFKRAIEDKYCGPLIKTVMTRCIHCTRCVRFVNEVLGTPSFGTIGRANSIEISSYIHKLFNSELSGNIVDLCPVGALTSKPYAFLFRPWELKSVESIDIFDSINSNIKIDVKGYDIIRILPRLNEYINDEWISDKVRYAFDGLFSSRLVNPALKDKQGVFSVVSWAEAMDIIYYKISALTTLKSKSIGFVVGPSCDFESITFIKRLTHLSNTYVFTDNSCSWLNSDFHNWFRFNTSFSNLYSSNVCLIMGLNPKTDGILLNYHLRKRYLRGNFNVAYFGYFLSLTFPTVHLGCSISKFISLLEGNSYFCRDLRKSRNPMIIIGKMFLNKMKNLSSNMFLNTLLSNLCILDRSWNIINFFNLNSKDFCFYDLSINCNFNLILDRLDILFILEEFKSFNIFSYSAFNVFLGHHGCLNAQKSNLILPTVSFVEKDARFGNCEGKYQYSHAATLSLGNSKNSSGILFNIITNSWCGNKHSFFNILDNYLSFLFPLIKYSLNQFSYYFSNNPFFLYSFVILSNSYIFSSLFDNFYKTDIVCQFSLNMSRCSKELLNKTPFKF